MSEKLIQYTENKTLDYSHNYITNIIHVSGLPFETTDEDVLHFFSNFKATFAKVFNKGLKCYAQVVFDTAYSAIAAREALNCEDFYPRNSQTGIIKPISISLLENENIREKVKKDLDKSVLVKNLSKTLKARKFFLSMRRFGEIKICKLLVDFSGQSKGCGYVYYTQAEDAAKAMQILSYEDKTLIVSHLIPGKTKENSKNNVYIKNIPKSLNEEDLRHLFSTFGEIKSVMISKDEQGLSKGFGFVCFVNPGGANLAIRTSQETPFTFEDGVELYVNYAQRKDERAEMLIKDSYKSETTKIFAKLRDDMYTTRTIEAITEEVKTFIKLLVDFESREIKVRLDSKTALIIFNHPDEAKMLMDKYIEYSNYYLPRIFLDYYMNKAEKKKNEEYLNKLNSMTDPTKMFSNFSNLNIVDQTITPIIKIEELNNQGKNTRRNPKKIFKNNNYYKNNNYGKKRVYSTRLVDYNEFMKKKEEKTVVHEEVKAEQKQDTGKEEDLASQIYEVAEKKFGENAGKITGMIVDLGLEEMKNLIEKPDQLSKIIEEANAMLSKNTSQ